jgi:uncharacterized protein DUF3467
MTKAMNIPEEAPSQPPKFEWLEAKENTPEIYGNFFHTSWTLVDVRIQVGQLVTQGADLSRFVAEPRGAVTMAWGQAKVLRDTLNSVLAKYEEVNGEIKIAKLADRPS